MIGMYKFEFSIDIAIENLFFHAVVVRFGKMELKCSDAMSKDDEKCFWSTECF